MNDWFVVDQGKRTGPFSFETLSANVSEGKVSSAALVWKSGLAGWEPVNAHFTFPEQLTASAESLVEVEVQPHRNPILRYWRGEYSLAISFWLVGVFGLVLVLFAMSLYTILMGKQEFSPYVGLAAFAPGWFVTGAFTVYHLIGTWRSAKNQLSQATNRTSTAFLVWAAQTVAVAGIVAFLILFSRIGFPRIKESWGIAFWNDPEIPAYSIRVMRNGTELEVAGGLKYGVAREFEAALNANPQLRVIHLSSDGGRLGEAEKLSAMIRARKLVTYTASACSSACTVIFAAGSERWLMQGASLGYHAASFAGDDSAVGMRIALIRQGVNKDFALRASQTSSKSIWFPTDEELTANGIISGTVDSYKFAASGHGIPPKIDKEIKDLLLGLAIFRLTEKSDSHLLETAVKDAQRVYLSGVSEGELLDHVRKTHLTPFVKMRLATANTKSLANFVELWADQLDALSHSDTEACFKYAAFRSDATFYYDLEDLYDREDQLLTEILQAPKVSVITPRFESLEILGLPDSVDASLYDRYCQIAVSKAREMSKLSQTESARFGREIVMKLYAK